MRFGKFSLFPFAINLEAHYLKIYIGTNRADFPVIQSD